MVAMAILLFAGLSLVRITFAMRLTAEDSLHQSTAMVLAQDYLEQLCRLPYISALQSNGQQLTGLKTIADDTPANPSSPRIPIPLYAPGGGPNPAIPGGGQIANLYNGTSYTQTVYLDEDGAGNKTFPMVFTFEPVLTDLSTITPAGTAQGVEITVYFSESYQNGSQTRLFQSSLRTVYANVQTM